MAEMVLLKEKNTAFQLSAFGFSPKKSTKFMPRREVQKIYIQQKKSQNCAIVNLLKHTPTSNDQ